MAALELTGYPLIPPELLGLEYNPDTRETYGVASYRRPDRPGDRLAAELRHHAQPDVE